ncbi:MAG TPA: 16S rRNA (guanine(527)-N(7))-methyltransferase RsmG [Clostridiaceae bacterium]|nr:16S rRNA (guanine(527)-N(7))-methyltransferase RsmG [Clostridiaceae bacterium]
MKVNDINHKNFRVRDGDLKDNAELKDGIKLKDLLVTGAKEFGIELNPDEAETFFSYMNFIKTWNNKFNLTAIEDDRDFIIKHFLDSLSILPYIKKFENTENINIDNMSIIDIGTGAGFPAIPLKILLKETNITMLDAVEKKVKFLNACISTLKLRNTWAFHGRAEDYGHDIKHRERYDIAVARAVASMPVLLEYCLPFVKREGIFIAMKGKNTEEVSISQKALEELGGKIQEVREIILPFSDSIRNIIIVKKFRQTPPNYPRKAGKPSKNPLI